jgi:hypothetical protein
LLQTESGFPGVPKPCPAAGDALRINCIVCIVRKALGRRVSPRLDSRLRYGRGTAPSLPSCRKSQNRKGKSGQGKDFAIRKPVQSVLA